MTANDDVTSAGRTGASCNGSDAAEKGPAPAADAPDEPGRRLLKLEAEVRALRALLEVRNEAFRALMGRLLVTELRAQISEGDRLARERDEAVALARVLQNLKVFRYTKWPRDLYGILLRLRRRLG